MRPAQARVPDTDFKSASSRALKAAGGPQKLLPGRAGARLADTAAQASTAAEAKPGSAALANTSSAIELTGGVASLQPVVAQVGGESVTVAVRSQAVLAAVQGRQEQFAAAAAAALKIARGERMQQRFERRKHQWESPPPAARADATGAQRSSASQSAASPMAAVASTPAPASLATATGDTLADDFRGVLGDAQMFVAERLEDVADEARCLGLAPAVAFDVSRAVFVSAATGAPLDLTRELGGVLFDNLGALADGAAMVLAASGSPTAAAGDRSQMKPQFAPPPLTAPAEAVGGATAAPARGSSDGVAGVKAPKPGAEFPNLTDVPVHEEQAATEQKPAPAVDIADFPKF